MSTIEEHNQQEIDSLLARKRDDELEQRIEQARVAMTAAETPEARREWHEEFRWLLEQRSPEQKARMAHERGLPHG